MPFFQESSKVTKQTVQPLQVSAETRAHIHKCTLNVAEPATQTNNSCSGVRETSAKSCRSRVSAESRAHVAKCTSHDPEPSTEMNKSSSHVTETSVKQCTSQVSVESSAQPCTSQLSSAEPNAHVAKSTSHVAEHSRQIDNSSSKFNKSSPHDNEMSVKPCTSQLSAETNQSGIQNVNKVHNNLYIYFFFKIHISKSLLSI